MQRITIRFLSVLVLAGATWLAPSTASAQVYDPSALTAAGYAPVYYIDNLVFFDAYGRPYYYDNGQAFYVPNTYEDYNTLVNHYRYNQAAYLRWYSMVGHRYLNYRRPAAASYYTPQYYDGYVVYYDGYGRPYYYANGARYYVPAGSPYYHGLVRHWRLYRGNYDRWYRSYGRVYRHYRRGPITGYYTPLYYDGYVVYYDGYGRPYYYLGGRQVWIPATYAGYRRYHDYWRTHRAHYGRWYRENGNRYRGYRSPSYHRGRTSYRVPTNRFRPGHAHPGNRGGGAYGRPGHRGGGGAYGRPGYRGGGTQGRPGYRGGGTQGRPGYRGGAGHNYQRRNQGQQRRQQRRNDRRNDRRSSGSHNRRHR